VSDTQGSAVQLQPECPYDGGKDKTQRTWLGTDESAEHPKVKDMYFGLAFAYYGAANDMYSTLPELSDFIYDENFTKLRIAIRDSHVFP
jgi:hypothetical protein